MHRKRRRLPERKEQEEGTDKAEEDTDNTGAAEVGLGREIALNGKQRRKETRGNGERGNTCAVRVKKRSRRQRRRRKEERERVRQEKKIKER